MISRRKLLVYISVFLSLGILNSCLTGHHKLVKKSVLYAYTEGVANCMTHLYFFKDGTIIQKSVCFGITSKKGIYTRQQDSIFIKGLDPDTSRIDLGILGKGYDLIGQPYKWLLYYRNSDTLKRPIGFVAMDYETKCPESIDIKDITDLSYIGQRLSRNDVLAYEKQSTPNDFGTRVFLSESYFPDIKTVELDSAISYHRNYVQGIPLETYYYFSEDSLMVIYYQWSSSCCNCFNSLGKSDYRHIYQQIVSKLTDLYGLPDEAVGSLSNRRITQFERIWDNDKEHMELHLYLYGNYRIRLIKYWK